MAVPRPDGLGPWGSRFWLALTQRWPAFERLQFRSEAVRSLEVAAAGVTAVLAPSGPGRPKIEAVIRRGGPTPTQWVAVQALLPLDLDGSESPARLERHLRRLGVDLFARDIRGECSLCGRPESGCAHLAELGFAFARRLDSDPLELVRFGGWLERAAPGTASAGHPRPPAGPSPVVRQPAAGPTPSVPPPPTPLAPAVPAQEASPIQALRQGILRALVGAGIVPRTAADRGAGDGGADDGGQDLLERMFGPPRRGRSHPRRTERVGNGDFWLGGAPDQTEPPPEVPGGADGGSADAGQNRVDLPLHLQPPPVVARKLDIHPPMRLVCAALREWGEREAQAASGEAAEGFRPALGFSPEEAAAPAPGGTASPG